MSLRIRLVFLSAFAFGSLSCDAGVPPTVAEIGPRAVQNCPTCTVSEPSWSQWQLIDAAIARISTVDSECAGIKEAAMMESFAIWSVDDWSGAYADHHLTGPYGDQTHIRDDNLTNADELVNSIIHEIAHHNGHNEEMADWYMEACFMEQ